MSSARVTMLTAVLALTACGGSDGSGITVPVDNTTYTQLSSTTATMPTQLRFVATTDDGVRSSGNAGTLQHDTNVISSGRLAGTINNARTEIDLNASGRAVLTNPANTDYLLVFATEGNGTPIFGVVGQVTASGGVPTGGNTTYNGSIDLTVADGNTIDTLSGDARIRTSWDNGQVDSRFNNFARGNTSVAGSIEIDNANISGNSFSGGSLSTTGNVFDVTGSASLSGTRGEFFGPGADEVGGVLLIDDTGSGTRRIVGVYSAN